MFSTSRREADRLLFDVGHQCYPHKLLTGRLPMLPKLRTREGMAGFPEPRESDFDLFSVGHAGTGISTGVGMARGDDVLAGGAGQSDRKVAVLVGDASIVNGVALEGLNNAGTLQRQFLTVLNDNGMSIAKPQGSLASSFDRVRVSQTYQRAKKRGKKWIEGLPGGSYIGELYHRGSEMLKDAIAHDHMLEGFGLVCVGPVDGHDLAGLIAMLEEIREINRPVLLHAKTIKGKGFDFSTGDPTAFHSPKPFKIQGCRVEIHKSGRSFTSAFSDAMIDLMGRDDKIFGVTAAMPDGTGMADVMTAFPARTLDTGICESHAMDMCAGMAKAGLKPYFAVYSTFAQRALDQVFQEVALQGLPVRICMDRAGFVGGDGAVHHGFMDISMLRALPGVVMLAASDEPNLRAGLEFMREHEAGPSTIRYPRDNVPAKPLDETPPPFELGKAVLVRDAADSRDRARSRLEPDAAILALGTMVYQASFAMDQLAEEGVEAELYDARFALPVDIELVASLLRRGLPIITIEDHALAGGFGAGLLEACNERGLPTHTIHRLGMPKKWVYQDSRANQLAEAGLDVASIAEAVRRAIDAAADPDPTAVTSAGLPSSNR